MRYFEKMSNTQHLQLFNKWKEENADKIEEWINDSKKTGSHLWEELGKTFGAEKQTEINPIDLRNKLEAALFEEQNGLCCYCGNSIERKKNTKLDNWEYRNRAIEHFDSKNKFKGKTFEYTNLMLCCKDSQRMVEYEIGKSIKGVLINGFEEVSTLTKLPVPTIKSHPKNKALIEREIKKGDKIFVPNPPHCDDEKSKFDTKKENTIIINPCKDKELIDRLIFNEFGEIRSEYTTDLKDTLIKNTLDVLALNCITLVESRRVKWKNAEIEYIDSILPLIENIERDLESTIIQIIDGKSLPNKEGVLEPFYFVEIAFLQSLFNGNKNAEN